MPEPNHPPATETPTEASQSTAQHQLLWRCRDRVFDLAARPLVMGILNVTPDSFSDGGAFLDPGRGRDRALEIEAEGADIIDVGGESTRPGADPVPEDEEIRRVLPVIEALRAAGSRVAISIDTRKAAVARAALEAGADIVNDVTALTGDPEMAAVCREAGAGVVLMHMQGDPQTMQKNPRYADVIRDVRGYLGERLAWAQEQGLALETLAIDPGIGFGKTLEHNLALLRGLGELAALGRPVLFGASRKAFLRRILWGDAAPEDWKQRDELRDASVGVAVASIMNGASIVRVHDVAATVSAAKIAAAARADGVV